MIPQHCIKKFEDTFKSFPLIIEMDVNDFTTITKLLKKSHLKWSFSKINENNQVFQTEKLVEYDSSGIFMYYKTEDNSIFKLFILHTIDRQSIVDFTIHNILKTIKN